MSVNVETIKHIGRNGDNAESVSNGNPLRKHISLTSWVKAVDNKVAESITLSKGTLWLIGVGFLCIQLLFNYGGSAISWARNDQTNVEATKSLKKQVEDLDKKVDDKYSDMHSDIKEIQSDMKEMNRGYQEMREQNATLRGAKFGAIANGGEPK